LQSAKPLDAQEQYLEVDSELSESIKPDRKDEDQAPKIDTNANNTDIDANKETKNSQDITDSKDSKGTKIQVAEEKKE
jgi:hypothetical protein